MVTDRQVRRLLKMKNKHQHQYQAADAAGICSKTASKYLKSGKLPSQCRVEHTWPTRQDPFADNWAFVVKLLEDTQATLESKTIFEYLQMAYPGKYHNGQLRTLQRRIKAWKALYGPSREIFFSQIYYPGQWACSDFTSMNHLNITIAHQPFEHLFYHFVLCYSNCHKCFAEETEVLKELPNLRYDDYEIRDCKVSRGGTFRVLHNTYSTHSRLVGETIKVRVYADHLQIWYAQRHIETLPRLRGENGHHINYRHIIDSLVRKPGAFENYCYKEDLFPTSQFRIAYDILTA